jgi:hypothetical protein
VELTKESLFEVTQPFTRSKSSENIKIERRLTKNNDLALEVADQGPKIKILEMRFLQEFLIIEASKEQRQKIAQMRFSQA